MKPRDLLIVLLVNLAFGFHPVAARFGVEHLPPVFFAMLRMLAVAAVLAPWIRWMPGQMGKVVPIGLLIGAFNFSFLFVGLSMTDDVATVSVVLQVGIPLAAVIGIVFLGERPSLQRIAGIVAGFLGVAIVTFDPRLLDHLVAMGFVLCSTVFGSIGLTMMRYVRTVPVFTVQGWAALLGILPMLLISLLFEHGHWPAVTSAGWTVWGALAWTVFITSLVGHGGMNYLIKRYPLSTVMPVQLIAPILTIAFGVLIYGNRLSLGFVIGGILTLAGVLLVIMPDYGRRP
jgi:O-acetylserine/cysteine efflux transporter